MPRKRTNKTDTTLSDPAEMVRRSMAEAEGKGSGSAGTDLTASRKDARIRAGEKRSGSVESTPATPPPILTPPVEKKASPVTPPPAASSQAEKRSGTIQSTTVPIATPRSPEPKPAPSTRRPEQPRVEAVTTSKDVLQSSISMRERIALLAYSYWEARGRRGGSPEEDWFRAEREVLGRAEVTRS